MAEDSAGHARYVQTVLGRSGSRRFRSPSGKANGACIIEKEPPIESLVDAISAGSLRIGALALAMFASGAGLVTLPQTLWQGNDPAASCAMLDPNIDAAPFLRTELFFGLTRPDGATISEGAWAKFLDEEVTSRFPDGLTVLSAQGHWLGENAQIVEERSKLLILLYPRESITKSHQAIEDIRAAYETRFMQESVLRADDDRPVCASF